MGTLTEGHIDPRNAAPLAPNPGAERGAVSAAETPSALGADETRDTREPEAGVPWSYLFVHRAGIDRVDSWLRRTFPTFVLKEVVYKMENERVRKTTRRVIPGLLFVQGEQQDISAKLREMASDLYLVKDCMTGHVAEIPDATMRAFMQITTVSSTRIRFMPHNLKYYAAGNALVRITSGALKGLEGYRIRIARNRCLVTSLGGMSIAISGVHKDSFENVDEYLRLRRGQAAGSPLAAAAHKDGLTCPANWQSELSQLLFVPETALDILTLAGKCSEYPARLNALSAQGRHTDALGAAIFLLEEIGCHFMDVDSRDMREALSEMQDVVDQLSQCAARIRANARLTPQLDLTLQAQLDSVRLRFPHLHLSL